MNTISVYAFLFLFLVATLGACESESTGEIATPDNPEIWTGATVTFEKTNDADPTLAANQDRITDKVVLTRGTDGGQLFNIQVESSSDKAESPTGTLWALGTTADIDDLDFQNFRATIKPKSVVGKDLVLFLVEEEIYIDLKFTKWSSNKGGGFAYERASE
ncbi:MAG: hypothetical protein AAGI23_06060 [Bacteroidota bacterium]